jgi:putative ABC transport system ATP-binding protein
MNSRNSFSMTASLPLGHPNPNPLGRSIALSGGAIDAHRDPGTGGPDAAGRMPLGPWQAGVLASDRKRGKARERRASAWGCRVRRLEDGQSSAAELAERAEEFARSGEPAIVLRGCGKRYGRGIAAVDALRDVDLQIFPGEFVVILGPSGSGKTTLLNVIGGIESATEGSVLLGGSDISRSSPSDLTRLRRDRVGFVFQFFNLIPTLTALENVQLIAEITGQDAEARSRAALSDVGLADVVDRFPAELSGGQQQRVAIARALVKEPPLLLCDEPTGSLDLSTGRQVLAVLRELARQGHHTVLLVTHNSAIARMADRIIRLGSGHVTSDEHVDAPVEANELEW